MPEQITPVNLGSTPYVVLAIYLLTLLVLGWIGYRKSRSSEEDYYLAGRGQGWVVSSLTIMATFFSSFALLGAPGMVYREGVVFALFSLNVPVGGLCVYLLGSRIWKAGGRHGFVTPADMVASYYDSPLALRLLVALTGFLYAIPYVMMQIKAGGDVSAVLFSGNTHAFEIGAVILALITTVYIMVGGMRSVAWTDVLQGVLLMGGMFLGGFATIWSLGGFRAFGKKLTDELPAESLTIPGTTGAWPWTMLITVCVLASSGSMVQPAQWMRYYSARNSEALRRGAVIFAVVLTACFILGVMFVGLGGQLLYPLDRSDGIAAHPDVGAFDRILVVLLRDQLPQLLGSELGVIMASVVIVAIMAASMSTADSNLHAMSAVAVRDIYERYMRPKASERERVWAGRCVIVAATFFSLLFVIHGEWRQRADEPVVFMQMIAVLGLTAIAFSAQLLPVTIDMLFLRRGTRFGATIGLFAGLVAAFLFSGLFPAFIDMIPAGFAGTKQQASDALKLIDKCKQTLPMHASAWGLLFNLPLFLVGSLVSRPVSEQTRKEYGEMFREVD